MIAVVLNAYILLWVTTVVPYAHILLCVIAAMPCARISTVGDNDRVVCSNSNMGGSSRAVC